MRIEFEDWVKNQSFSKSVIFLYEESFKSYRGQAFSAALMYTHLAFFESIKQKIRKVQNIPDGINEIEWERNYLKPILNDDTWDTSIYTFLTQKDNTKKSKKIFNLPDVIREEITYWKNKRNTAVHFRNEKINYAHVESYWNFIENNYLKINVIGSKSSYFDKIEEFFNPELTSDKESDLNLIEDLKAYFDPNDSNFFFKIITSTLKIANKKWEGFITNLIVKHYNHPIIDQINHHFAEDLNTSTLHILLRNNPQILSVLTPDNKTIRSLWRNHLFKTGFNDFNIINDLFIHKYLNEESSEEVFNHIFSDVVSQDFIPSNLIIKNLNKFKFYECFEDKLFNNLEKSWDFNRMNNQANYYLFFLENYPIEELWLKGILVQLDASKPPKEFAPKFQKFIKDNDKIKLIFKNYITNKFTHLSRKNKLNFFSEEELQE